MTLQAFIPLLLTLLSWRASLGAHYPLLPFLEVPAPDSMSGVPFVCEDYLTGVNESSWLGLSLELGDTGGTPDGKALLAGTVCTLDFQGVSPWPMAALHMW